MLGFCEGPWALALCNPRAVIDAGDICHQFHLVGGSTRQPALHRPQCSLPVIPQRRNSSSRYPPRSWTSTLGPWLCSCSSLRVSCGAAGHIVTSDSLLGPCCDARRINTAGAGDHSQRPAVPQHPFIGLQASNGPHRTCQCQPGPPPETETTAARAPLQQAATLPGGRLA
jgi:hypothetical protein